MGGRKLFFGVSFILLVILFSIIAFAQTSTVNPGHNATKESPTEAPIVKGFWAKVGNVLFTIKSKLNVGIGTSDPKQKLEVAGGVRLKTYEDKPTCDEDARGTLWFTRGSNGDILEVCKLKSSSGQGSVNLLNTTFPSNKHGISCAEDSSTHKIYCFGGYDISPSNEIYEFDSSNGNLVLKSAILPKSLFESSCVEDKSTHLIYCFGGETSSGVLINDVFQYNPATDTLTTVSQLPAAIRGTSCAQDSSTNFVYCFGGLVPGASTNLIFMFDPGSNSAVTMGARLPTARADISCVEDSQSHLIYCFGGETWSGQKYNDILEYDPSTDVISIKSMTLTEQKSSLSCVGLGATNEIYCFGGELPGFSPSSAIEKYDPVINTVTFLSLQLPFPNHALSCAEDSLFDNIYCFGGLNSKNIVEFHSGGISADYRWFPVA